MKLDNHIAQRFISDDNLAVEIVLETYPQFTEDSEDEVLCNKVKTLVSLLNKRRQKSYWITNTVLDKLDMLKVKRSNSGYYDWTVFKNLEDMKVTFIFPDNRLLRMQVVGSMLCFCYLKTEKMYDSNTCKISWVLFYLDRFTGEVCDYFKHNDVQSIEEFVYKLLCFMYLSENTEVVIDAGRKAGTKKSGKIINTLPVPLTIVDSNWNVTSIRTEGFSVSGHFALRRVGEGRQDVRMVFIQPYEKSGYIRKAKKVNYED